MVRAVHGLEEVLFALFRSADRLEAVFAVFLVVARTHIELFVADVWGDHALVSGLLLCLFQELLQTLAECSAFGQPHGQTLADALREGEELQLLAQLAVVAFLGFFQQSQVLLKHGSFWEGHAVDARQLRIVLVAAPVGTGHTHDFSGLD